MPTYQYVCTTPDCGNAFERVQSFTDPAASECPVCGGPVRKVFSSVGVVFKGSGFYRTDSRADASKGENATTSSDTPAGTGSSSSDTSSSSSDTSSSSSSSSSSKGNGAGKSGGSGSGSTQPAASSAAGTTTSTATRASA